MTIAKVFYMPLSPRLLRLETTFCVSCTKPPIAFMFITSFPTSNFQGSIDKYLFISVTNLIPLYARILYASYP